jgi:glycosyltransferase involved in cell wall biosynthesis
MTNSLVRLSVLVIHYRRTDLAINCVKSIRHLGLESVEYILSDDGSKDLDIRHLRPYFDSVIVSCKNKGLGHNMNQGIMSCRGEYVLVMQEDTEFTGSLDKLILSMAALDAFPTIEMIRYYNAKLVADNMAAVRLLDVQPNEPPIYVINHHHPRFCGAAYSDMPHLRRNPCFPKTEWMYLEGARMEAVETDYLKRFAVRDQLIAFLDPSTDYCVHRGALVSHRTRQWDYRLANFINKILSCAGISPKSPLLKPFRKVFLSILPHYNLPRE